MDESLHTEVEATLVRLKTKHPDLKKRLDEAYGYAVFPSIARASLVVGGAHGKGEVFERAQPIGFASLSQLTVGVQIGGQTFSELLFFDSKEALKEFKNGPVTFTANASAVIVKAAASGTTDYKGVTAMAFSEGGELLEASLGGQKATYYTPSGEKVGARSDASEQEDEQDSKRPGLAARVAAKFHRGGGKEQEERGEERAAAPGGEADERSEQQSVAEGGPEGEQQQPPRS